MELVIFDNNKVPTTIKFENNVIFFGQNNQYKIDFIKNLKDGFIKNNIILNGRKIDKNEYNVIYISEQNDFEKEFKFNKNNSLKQIIYNEVINKINEDKLINYTNELFDVIDNKINNLINKKINRNSENNLSFQIEIPNVDSIIDKFTNIYIDNILLNSDTISKSMKRKLLYETYFWEIDKNKNMKNIMIIENFDTYLNTNEIIDLMTKIEKISKNNCNFILTTNNNIFEYIPTNVFNIYKVNNKILNFNIIDNAIKNYLIKNEYYLSNCKDTFENYYVNNEKLITNEEVNNIKHTLLNKYPHLISKILNCTTIKIVPSKPKYIRSEYIICENKSMLLLFTEISQKFID